MTYNYMQSVLGMNIFDFDDTTGRLRASRKDIWIFFVITVPLTIITLFTWQFMKARQDISRRLRDKVQNKEP
jgi:hypothetical protein